MTETAPSNPGEDVETNRRDSGAPVPLGLRNLFLDRLKALLSQEASVLDELRDGAAGSHRRRDLFSRLRGDARALSGDALAFGLPRVSEIGSAVEALLAHYLAARDGAKHRQGRECNEVMGALASALEDIGAEVERAESRTPAPVEPPSCLPRLAGARESLAGGASAPPTP